MHDGPLLAEVSDDHLLDAGSAEQLVRQQLDRGRRGALPDADHHRPLVQHEDVAALEAGRVAVVGIVAVPDGKPGVTEPRVVPVDGAHVERLRIARRCRQHVVRHAMTDPRGVVPHEQQVRKRPQHIVETVADEVGEQVVDPPLHQLLLEQSPEQHADQHADRPVPKLGPQRPGDPDPAGGRRDHPVDEVVPHPFVGQHVPEQVGEVEHLDPPLAHQGHEAVVLLLGPLDPQQVVEQQPVLVLRGQARHLDAGPVDDHLPQRADLGVDAVSGHGREATRAASAAGAVPTRGR